MDRKSVVRFEAELVRFAQERSTQLRQMARHGIFNPEQFQVQIARFVKFRLQHASMLRHLRTLDEGLQRIIAELDETARLRDTKGGEEVVLRAMRESLDAIADETLAWALAGKDAAERTVEVA